MTGRKCGWMIVLTLGVAMVAASALAADERDRPSRGRREPAARDRERQPMRLRVEMARPRPEPRRPEPRRSELRRPELTRPEPRRPEPKRPPKPVVIQFQHISAESFMGTLGQLARNPHVAGMMHQMPHAVNEEANAFVIIAPPEAAGFLMSIARELDRPCEFHERNRQREREERVSRLRMEMAMRQMAGMPHRPGPPPRAEAHRKPVPPHGAKAKAGHKPAPPHGAKAGHKPAPPHGAKAGHKPEPHKRPMPKKPPAKPKPRPERDPDRKPEMGHGNLGALLAPPVIKQLELAEWQVQKIRGVIAETHRKAERVMAEARGAAEKLHREGRTDEVRKVKEKIKRMQAELAKALRKRIFSVLNPGQREKAEKLLAAHRPGHGEPPRHKDEPKEPKHREHRR